ncbi:MAG: hypothetical protein LQ349_004842 [Xanthoria aureola]|nr:MAG: hypothetical protein LQ349_004842 [Xanthoria aureola]
MQSLKHLRQTSPQQVESRSLPKSIRDLDKFTLARIFRLCLVSQHPTPIVVEEQPDWYGEAYYTAQIYSDEEKVRLTTRRNSDVTVALLQLSSTIHEEAARILYGLNTFSFGGENCWIDPIYFKWRLTDISRRNVRTLVIKIPEIDRGRDGELNGATLNGHKSLKNFPGL